MHDNRQLIISFGVWVLSLSLLSRRAVNLLVALFLPLLLLSSGLSFAKTLPVTDEMKARDLSVSSASEYDYPPFCIVTPDNQADGFSVELLRASLKAMGRDVSFQIGSWAEVKQMLTAGTIEVLPLVGRTPEREELYDFTFPYMTMHGTIVVREEETAIRTFSDLKGKRIAVMQGDNAEESLSRSKLAATIVSTTTFDEALHQLVIGKQDAVVIQKLLALQLMANFPAGKLKTVGPPLEDFMQSFCFAVTKGNHKLLSVLNEGLSLVIADGTFRYLREKWFGPIESVEFEKSRIVIGGDSDYPPYEFLDENGQPTGYNVELTRAIARQSGLNVEIQLGSWDEIRKGLADGKIDAVHGMFYSLERDAVFDFSPPHAVISYVVACREGSECPQTMAALQGKSILVMAGDIMHDQALKLGYEKQLILVKSQEEALKRLAGGQADCALVAKIPALYWIQKYAWKNLHFSDQALLSPEYCYAVPHGNFPLLAHLLDGLKSIQTSGEYRDIYSRWLGVYEEPALTPFEALQYSLFIIVPIILLLLGSILWSWSLKSKVTIATASLKDEKQRLASIIEGTKAGTWEWNIQTGAVVFNNEWAETIGYTLDELLPVSIETWIRFAHPDDLQKSNRLLEKHFSGETEFYEFESRMLNKEGQWVWVHDRGKVASWTDDGKPLLMFGTHLNITARRRTEEEKAALIHQLQDRTAEQERFVYTVSHDLKSPLVTISGFAGILEQDFQSGKTESCQESLTIITKATQRMKQLLDELLELSRIGIKKISPEIINLDHLIKCAIENVSGQINSVGAIVDVAPDLPEAKIDRQNFLQVFENLIGNAAKFSGDAEGGPVIHIGVRRDNDNLVCFVKDNGIGIEPCYTSKVFELFEKINPSPEGTGVGLAIVKRIIEVHGGRIWIESKGLGHGSTFYFTLPEARC